MQLLPHSVQCCKVIKTQVTELRNLMPEETANQHQKYSAKRGR